MLILENAWCLEKPDITGHQCGRRIAVTIRVEPLQLQPQGIIDFVQTSLSIHPQNRLEILRLENAPAIMLQAPFELPDAVGRQGETCRLRVTSETIEEVA